MFSSTLSLLMILLLLVIATIAVFLAFLIVLYTPIIMRIFEEKPMFLPLRVSPRSDGEDVRFTTVDGLELGGTYLPSRTESRSGVLVFCHEFLSDRWSYFPYADAFRDLGFDLFTFDFRNHGASASDRVYQPLQWVSDHEVRDLQAALTYLRSREDRDPAGFGIFGISKGGGTAIAVAASQPDVWGVVTDGAFPTRGTMYTYILRWAQIFVTNRVVYAILRDLAPRYLFGLLSWVARRRAERKLSCRFPGIERRISRLSPRPLLMIHGAKDAYIGPDLAQRLFDDAREPKELWIVPGAKHNRCREVDPAAYSSRIVSFLRQYAPRPLVSLVASESEQSPSSDPQAPVGEATQPTVNRPSPLDGSSLSEPAPTLANDLTTSVPR